MVLDQSRAAVKDVSYALLLAIMHLTRGLGAMGQYLLGQLVDVGGRRRKVKQPTILVVLSCLWGLLLIVHLWLRVRLYLLGNVCCVDGHGHTLRCLSNHRSLLFVDLGDLLEVLDVGLEVGVARTHRVPHGGGNPILRLLLH